MSLYPDFANMSSVRDLSVTLDSALSSLSTSCTLVLQPRTAYNTLCYYNLRCLRPFHRSVFYSHSSSVFSTTVHAFFCNCLDYCNSFYSGLPKTCWDIFCHQSVFNSAARLITHLSRFSLVSTFMIDRA